MRRIAECKAAVRSRVGDPATKSAADLKRRDMARALTSYIAFSCVGLLMTVGGVDGRNDVLKPYLEWEWPPRGHPFIRGEEDIFAGISAHHITEESGEPYTCLVEISNEHGQKISSNSFGVTGQFAQFQKKDARSRGLQFELPSGTNGKFTLRASLQRGQ
eukprot:743751-Rhodomonas_salina.1